MILSEYILQGPDAITGVFLPGYVNILDPEVLKKATQEAKDEQMVLQEYLGDQRAVINFQIAKFLMGNRINLRKVRGLTYGKTFGDEVLYRFTKVVSLHYDDDYLSAISYLTPRYNKLAGAPIVTKAFNYHRLTQYTVIFSNILDVYDAHDRIYDQLTTLVHNVTEMNM